MQKGVVAGTFRSDKLAGLNFGTARKHIIYCSFAREPDHPANIPFNTEIERNEMR